MAEIVSPRFIGRAEELRRLGDALAAATRGRGGALIIGGEGGVGKSRLVAEFLAHARSEGALVLTGGCIRCGDGGPPYWPFIDALRGLFDGAGTGAPLHRQAVAAAAQPFRQELARLLPEAADGPLDPPAGLPAAAAPSQPYAAVLGLLTRLGEQRPVVLAVEDLQWADRSTQDLLSFLLTNLVPSRMLVVATYRSDALVHGHSLVTLLAELRRSRRADLLDLGRFSLDELTFQLESILGAPPAPEVVATIWARSEGNAFFAEELLATGATPGRMLPATLSQVLLARVAGLSDTGRQVLRMMATGGQGVGHRLLACVAGGVGSLPESALLDALRECVASQVVVADREGEAYRFRHGLVQEAVYDDLLPGERTRFHAAYARTLDADPSLSDATTAAKLAYHWERAGDHERALAAAVAAAAAAEALYGFAEAHQHLERALELWSLVPDAAGGLGMDRLELFERAAEAADMAGNHRRASALVSAALTELCAGVGRVRRAVLQQRLGRYLWASGDSEAALVAYDEAVNQITPDTGSLEWARIVASYAEALMWAGRYRESRLRAEAALEVARAVGARADEGHILATLGFDLAFLGEPAAGVAQLEESLGVAVEIGNPNDVGRAYLNLAELLSGPLNRLAEGAAVAEEGVVTVRRLGLDRSYGVSLQAIAVNTLFRLGRWPDADEHLRQALALNPTGAAAIELRLARARLSVGRGSFGAARSDLHDVTRMCAHATDPRHRVPLLTLTAGLALWEGRLDDARQAVATGLEQAADSEDVWVVAPLVWHGLRVESDTAELARSRRRPDQVTEARSKGTSLQAQVTSLEERAQGAAAPVRQAVSAWARMSEAELSRLDGASSPDAWAQAAAIWDGLGQPYPTAYARYREAEALLSQRARSSRAAELLRDVHRIALGLAAAPLGQQVELLAERARIRLDDPAAVDPPVAASVGEPEVPAALASLTKRERDVLLLVAEGHTNRQIADALYISDKTASVHVSHILAKLGVTSRVHAGAIAHRLGLAAP